MPAKPHRNVRHSRSTFPYGAYLVGHFEEYKDPGHFVGRGWMELKFDHMVVGNDTNIPIIARVVDTSAKYPVDKDGRIHGTGHPVRDTVEWLIPVLWPIDLINLPRRGPRPVLKPETRLTLEAARPDVGVPTKQEVQHQPELVSRFNYSDPDPAPGQQADTQQPAPIERQPPPMQQPQYQQPAPLQQAYAQPAPQVIIVQAPAPLSSSKPRRCAAGAHLRESAACLLPSPHAVSSAHAVRVSALIPALLRPLLTPTPGAP